MTSPWTEDDWASLGALPAGHIPNAEEVARLAAEDQAEAEQQRIARLFAREMAEYELLVARDRARKRYQQEQAVQVDVPDPIDLDDLLNEPDEEITWRIDGLWPAGGNVVLAAQYKAGKTTMVGNLVRSLVDGDRFLGIYPVEPVEGTVALTDFEMPRKLLKRWLRDQGIQNRRQVKVWTLRGQGTAFDLLDEGCRAAWVERLKANHVTVWIVDCLGPILSALGMSENENREVGRVLDALISVGTEAGVGEILLVHHMGHQAERSRGASRLRDWPDAEWRLVRQKDDDGTEPQPDAPRFFSAFGRDVDVKEGQLFYDKASRRLSYANGTRREIRESGAKVAVLAWVRDNPGKSGRDVEAGASAGGGSRADVRAAIKELVGAGFIATVDGEKRAKLHTITPPGLAEIARLTGQPPPDHYDPWEDTEACDHCGQPLDSDAKVGTDARVVCSTCLTGGAK